MIAERDARMQNREEWLTAALAELPVLFWRIGRASPARGRVSSATLTSSRLEGRGSCES